jgi:hypothetical protein
VEELELTASAVSTVVEALADFKGSATLVAVIVTAVAGAAIGAVYTAAPFKPAAIVPT